MPLSSKLTRPNVISFHLQASCTSAQFFSVLSSLNISVAASYLILSLKYNVLFVLLEAYDIFNLFQRSGCRRALVIAHLGTKRHGDGLILRDDSESAFML